MQEAKKTLRVRLLGPGGLTVLLVSSFKTLEDNHLGIQNLDFHAGDVKQLRLHIVRDKNLRCTTDALKPYVRYPCSEVDHMRRIQEMLTYKRGALLLMPSSRTSVEEAVDELIVLVVSEGWTAYDNAKNIRATRTSFDHAVEFEAVLIREALMLHPHTRVVVVVMTHPGKPPPRVTKAECKQLAASGYARDIIFVASEQSHETWQQVLTVAFKQSRKEFQMPSSRLVYTVLQGEEAEFEELLKSGQGFKSQPGFPNDQTPLGAFLHREVKKANAKFTLLMESPVADLVTQRLFLVAVSLGVAVPLLLKHKLLQKPEDYEMFLEYPSEGWEKVINMVFEHMCAMKIPFTPVLKKIYNTRALDLTHPPFPGVDYATVFIENWQKMEDEHECRNRMTYLMQHRFYEEAKSVIATIGLEKALKWTPERNTLHRVMWLHMCKVKDRNPQFKSYVYQLFSHPDSWRLRAVAFSSPHLVMPFLYVPRLEDLAATAVLMHSAEELMHVPSLIYEYVAQPPPTHFCFLRLAPIPVQERFRKYMKAFKKGFVFNAGAHIAVKFLHGYKSRNDYATGEIKLQGQIKINGVRFIVKMDDQGYLFINKLEGGACVWAISQGTQMDSAHGALKILEAAMKEIQVPPDDMIPFLVVLYNWLHYSEEGTWAVLKPMRLGEYQLTQDSPLAVPYWWRNVHAMWCTT